MPVFTPKIVIFDPFVNERNDSRKDEKGRGILGQ